MKLVTSKKGEWSVKDTRGSEISLTLESISLSSMFEKKIKSIRTRAGTQGWKLGDTKTERNRHRTRE